MSVSANYNLGLAVDETQNMGDVIGNVTFAHTTVTAGKLDSTTVPNAQLIFHDSFDIDAAPLAVGVLDLTSMATGPLGSTVDFSTKKIRLVKISAHEDNTDVVTVSVNVATGYNLFGPTNATADRVILSPGCSIMAYQLATAEVIDATHKMVLFASPDADANVTVELVAGVA